MRIVVVMLSIVFLPSPIEAAETWGSSVAATSDYLVRGISRSLHDPAVQADLHVETEGGLMAGVFASSVKLDSSDARNAELNAFLGFAWQVNNLWRAKAVASYYGYAKNNSGSKYNYAEVSLEAAFNDWLDIDVVFSPDAPRYIADRGLSGVSAESAELNARTPWLRRVAATAGVGYSHYGGPQGGGFGYWSAGGILDLAPVSISLAYVSTQAEAAALFYSAACHNRWTATLIWRF